jgi:hypothetical protein
VFLVKTTKFFVADAVPFLTWIRDGKIQIMDKHSGFNFRFKLSIVVDRHRFDEPDPSFYQMPI